MGVGLLPFSDNAKRDLTMKNEPPIRIYKALLFFPDLAHQFIDAP